MSLWTKVRDTVTNPSTAIGTVLGGGVGGTTLSTAFGNAVRGQPISSGLPGAVGLDLAGLGAGMGLSGLGLVGKGVSMIAGGGGTGPNGQVVPSGGYAAGGGGLSLTDLAPGVGAAYLGNQERQGLNTQIGKINQLGDQLGDQSGAYLRSITNPYDQQTGLGRTSLSNALTQRGVGGSSFGNQQLENYDYMRGLGRGDLSTRATTGLAATQGGLYGNALTGMLNTDQLYNTILGQGLNASGRLLGAGGASTGIPGVNGGLFSNLGTGFGNVLGNIGGSLGNTFGSPGSNWWGTGGTQVGGSLGQIDPFTGLSSNYPDLLGVDSSTGFWG